MTIQLTLYNRTVDENKIINNILIKPQSDNLNEYRDANEASVDITNILVINVIFFKILPMIFPLSLSKIFKFYLSNLYFI